MQVDSPTLPDSIRKIGILVPVNGFASCVDRPHRLPGVTWHEDFEGLLVCIYGVPEGEEVWYEIYDPWERLVGNGAETAVRMVQSVFVAVELPGATPLRGEWRVTLSSPSVREVLPLSVYPAVRLRLTAGPQVKASGRDLFSLREGDELGVSATNLPANAPIAIGFYYRPAGAQDAVLQLHQPFSGISGTDGAYSEGWILDYRNVPGEYCVVVSTSSDYQGDRVSADGAVECFKVK